MSDLLTRLNRVQDYFVKEGLGFDDYCICVEEAIAALKGYENRLADLEKRYSDERIAHREQEQQLRSRLGKIIELANKRISSDCDCGSCETWRIAKDIAGVVERQEANS
jgi:hypothetical protein